MRSLQRWRKFDGLTDKRRGPVTHKKALTAKEKTLVLSTLNTEEFYNLSPHRIVAMLADRGVYQCSTSTMYRLLRKENLLEHRRRSKRPTKIERIETIATKPNQVWCWDITFLRTPISGRYLKLYMYMDIFSRKILGWEIHENEKEQTSIQLFLKILESEGISGEGLRVHNDNGSTMRGSMFVDKLKLLGVIQSCSRPNVSNDNPFSEALFKTMKYRPEYPYGPFRSIERAREWVEKFVYWYNNEHLHGGISYVTPASRHQGKDEVLLNKRREVFLRAMEMNPDRWSGKVFNWNRPQIVELSAAGCRKVK